MTESELRQIVDRNADICQAIHDCEGMTGATVESFGLSRQLNPSNPLKVSYYGTRIGGSTMSGELPLSKLLAYIDKHGLACNCNVSGWHAQD